MNTWNRDSMKIITIASEKGGSGKTTSALALGQGLNHKKRKTLLIDLDGQQAGLTLLMGAKPTSNNAYDVLRGKCTISDAITHTDLGDIVPHGLNMESLETEIKTGREIRLKKALSDLQGYEYVIIDTPPAMGVLVDNALTTSDGVIIPARADGMGLASVYSTIKQVRQVQEYTNPRLEILGILITDYNGRTVVSRETVEELEDLAGRQGTVVYQSKIRQCSAIQEDQKTRANLFKRSKKCNAVKDYSDLMDEIISQLKM